MQRPKTLEENALYLKGTLTGPPISDEAYTESFRLPLQENQWGYEDQFTFKFVQQDKKSSKKSKTKFWRVPVQKRRLDSDRLKRCQQRIEPFYTSKVDRKIGSTRVSLRLQRASHEVQLTYQKSNEAITRSSEGWKTETYRIFRLFAKSSSKARPRENSKKSIVAP